MMAKAGIFGIGLDTYWRQFGGLFGKLTMYPQQIIERLSGFGAEVVDAGLEIVKIC